MAAAGRVAVDITNLDVYDVPDSEWNDLIDAHTAWCEADTGMYKFSFRGRLKGQERSIVDAWENLTSRDCHSWKYLEIDTKAWDNVPWLREQSNLDKWEEYLPIFNVNNFGGKVYQDTFGMYARGLDIPLRIEDPFCNAVTKVVIEGKVSRAARFVNPQKRFSARKSAKAIFRCADEPGCV
jgi:hypothetical protein